MISFGGLGYFAFALGFHDGAALGWGLILLIANLHYVEN